MDIGFWIGAAVGFITFVISVGLAIKESREGDADWRWAAILAGVGLVGTVVSIHEGIAGARESAAAAKRFDETEKKLTRAQGAIEGERRARAELVDGLRTRHVPEFMDLREFSGTKVIFVCANDPESLWFTHSLGFELEGQGWRIVDAEIRERVGTGVSVTPLGLYPVKDDDPALKARRALVSELEEGGVMVNGGGEMGTLPPNTVKIFVGPSPPFNSPSQLFRDKDVREMFEVNNVEEFVRPVFQKWQKGENAFIIWRDDPNNTIKPTSPAGSK